METRISDPVARRSDLARLRGEFRAANAQLRDELRGDMRAMEQRMLWEIGHAISAGVDQTAKMIAALDDKYRDLPARGAALEAARDDRE